MTYLLITLHVLVCIALIIIVLLQAGKGADIGASFGAGGSQTVFGASGGKSFMSKLTTGAAIIFMLTSLTLTYFYGQPATVMPATVPSQQGAATPVPGARGPEPAPIGQPAGGEQKTAPAPGGGEQQTK